MTEWIKNVSDVYFEKNSDLAVSTFVNAHINNISFPKTIAQLETFIYEHGCYNMEDVINEATNNGYTVWTVPRTSVVGDIVLYFHAKTAIQWISKMESATKTLDSEKHDKKLLTEWLQRARKLYSLYGGKIFAIGRIGSRPEKEDALEFQEHWRGRIYAHVKDLYLLEAPIDISEFNSFIMISRQSAITPLPSKEFEELKLLLKSKNNIPQWFLESRIGDNKLSKVNLNNFLKFTKFYRKRFPLEINFRSYYVDYFLKTLSGNNIYKECLCHSIKTPLARVDNVFEFNGKKILLEVKLNIALEDDLVDQINQYISADYICLTKDLSIHTTDFEKSFMFVIDVYSVYKFEVKNGTLVKLFDLDEIKNKNDIVSQMMNVT